MANDREQTGCCGLYCGDCIPANQSLFDAAATLRQQLDDGQFEQYAEHKSTHNKTFNAYQTFREVLDAILTLRCPKTCFHGGGNPHCAIRACALQKALEGCWQCDGFETCGTLQILCTCHGDTVKHNLRMIRQHGVQNWWHARGRHYTWQRSNQQHRRHVEEWTMERYKVDFGSLPWQQPAVGVRFKACEQDGRRLRLAEFTKDFVEPDWCTKGHTGYVLEGEIEVDFHGHVVTFRAGDGLFIPPGDEHGHKARVPSGTARVFLVETI